MCSEVQMQQTNKSSDNIFDKIEKVQKLIRMMAEDEGASITEMSEAVSWSRWTIKRFIDTIPGILNVQEIEDKALQEDKRESRWKIDKDSTWEMTLYKDVLKPDEQELFSLLLGMASNIPVLGTSSESLQKKIKWIDNKPSQKIINIPKVRKRTNENTKKVVSVILKAIDNQEWLEFEYYKMDYDENKKSTVKPLYLFIYEDNIYLRCVTTYNEYYTTYAIERFVGVPEIIPAERIINVDEKDIDSLYDPFGPFGSTSDDETEAVIKLDDWQGYYADLLDWPSDKVSIEENEDGTYLMKVRTNSWYSLVKWIMEQGSSATVLSPQSLKDDVISEIKKMLGNYEV